MEDEADSEMEAIRQLVADRARELRLTLQDLSVRAGKNKSYVQQFVTKGTPKRLPEDLRHFLARELQVPEESLRPAYTLPPSSAPLALPAPATALRPRAVPTSDTDVPVYSDQGIIDPTRPLEYTPRPPALVGAGNGVFAVYMSETSARLRPGDLAFIRPAQPPRQGDTVLVLQNDVVSAAGDLTEIKGDSVTVLTGTGPATFERSAARILKVAYIACG